MILPIEELIEGQNRILQRLEKIENLSQKNPLRRYSPQEIANNTPLGIHTVWNAIKDGRIKAQVFGKKYLITEEEFERVCQDAKSIKYKRTV